MNNSVAHGLENISWSEKDDNTHDGQKSIDDDGKRANSNEELNSIQLDQSNNNNAGGCGTTVAEETIAGVATMVHSGYHRTNPFDVPRIQKVETPEMKTISPEIEQQRASSILKDLNFKRAALAQLVVASMELLRSLPEENASNLELLMTPTIREAFRLVQLQANEMKVNTF